MNEANVYAPPQTDIRQNVGHEGDDPALKAMSTKDLKKLFNHSHTIRALIFLWCLGVALMTIAAPFLLIASTGEGKESREALTYGIIYSVAGGIFQLPSRIDGAFSLGQYIRIIRMNLPAGAGSQFDSRSLPGESFWISRSIEPSALRFRSWRALIE